MNLKRFIPIPFICLIVLLGLESCENKNTMSVRNSNIKLPEEVYGDLFYDVLSCDDLFGDSALFSDSKDFLDATPKFPIESIVNKYKVQRQEISKDSEKLHQFFLSNFNLATDELLDVKEQDDINKHIKELWQGLKRENNNSYQGTLIPLRHSYIVPGGRFREVYYWDSYFTMLGLKVDGEIEIIEDMVDNFAGLIDEVGFIPNGNRTYYISRS